MTKPTATDKPLIRMWDKDFNYLGPLPENVASITSDTAHDRTTHHVRSSSHHPATEVAVTHEAES